MRHIENRFSKWVITYRWWIIVATLLITGLAGSGVRFLTFDNDIRVFFSKENPQLKAFEALENTYTKHDTVFFAIAPMDGNVFTKRNLEAVKELTAASWKIPYSSRVDSVTNFQHTRGEEDELIVEDLVDDPTRLSDDGLKRIKKIAMSEPFLLNNLISSSGHVTGIVVSMIKPEQSMNEALFVAKYARDLINEFRSKYPDIKFCLTGGTMIDSALGEAADRDMKNLIPIMYLVVFGLMAVFFRSFSKTFGAIATIGAVLVTSMGLAGWIGIELNPISACAPTIILTLAIADSVHILTTIFQLMRQGEEKIKAIIGSLRINYQAVILTSVTTVIGFLTMNFSDAPPFRDLGNIVAIGVISALIYSLLFLPALMAVLPMKARTKSKYISLTLMDHLAEFVILYRKPIFYGMIALMIIASLGITQIKLNDDFIKFYDHSFEFRRDTDFVEENLGGFYRIEYSLESGESGGIHNPEYLKVLERFAQWYRTQPSVTHVSVITDTIKRLNKNLHSDDNTFYCIPENRDEIAQYLLLYEMSLPFGLSTNDMINIDKSSLRMSVSLRDVTSQEILRIDEKAYNWLFENAPKAMVTGGAGIAIMFSHISKRNIESMLGVTIAAILVVTFTMMVAMRVFKIGIVFIIPNLMPAIMAFGVWGFFFERVGMVISVMASLTLGIIVDDSIHFISKYLRARRELNFTSIEAVRYSFKTVGNALWLTTLVTASGFSVLIFSGFQMNTDLGSMTAITIIIALMLDFFLLPTLLIKMEGSSNVSEAKHIESKNINSPCTHINAYTIESGRE